MGSCSPTIPLEDGLDLRQIMKGSVLQINLDYDETQDDSEQTKIKTPDFIGKPVSNFKELEKIMTKVDESGMVKKKILEEGGGIPLTDEFTVSIAYSGYWEGASEAFDTRNIAKPLVVNLKDHGLLPGLEMAIKTMLVGEVSIFLLSYKVMYGELGLPPRIKPKEDCVFYIKLIKSKISPKNGEINFKEPNMFERVHHEAKLLMSSGLAMYKAKNVPIAVNLFRKAVIMLHKCRLADENEEQKQVKLLIKLYLNMAICYNDNNQPLKACTACNELNRLDSLWNNPKALLQNAKALRMIGQFTSAEKRLKRAMTLSPNSETLTKELELIITTRESIKKNKLISERYVSACNESISKEFKEELDKLLTTFKNNNNVFRLSLPPSLNSDELKYVKEACIRENLFVSSDTPKNAPLSKTTKENSNVQNPQFFLDKNKDNASDIYNPDNVGDEKQSNDDVIP